MAWKHRSWNHKKFGKGFVGSYQFTQKGERVFVLVRVGNMKVNGRAYESHEAAKRDGWKAA